MSGAEHMNDTNELVVDVVVIGGGQAGLSASYYLRKSDLDFVILDAQRNPGGAWQRGWNSLRLFSPAEYSSLPGRQMPPSKGDGFPTRIEVLNYLEDYENRYRLPIERPVRVQNIEKQPNALRVQTDNGTWLAKAVISATGTWSKPYIPHYDGAETFRGQQLHSAEYVSPEGLTGKSILIISGGNSGAQIYAELSRVAGTIWATLHPPKFLPDDVDGRVLFDRASARYGEGSPQGGAPLSDLGDIVMVPSVLEARDRGILRSVRPPVRFTEDRVVWEDGTTTAVDAVIWCTGFHPALDHLDGLGIKQTDGKIAVTGTRSIDEPRLWLLGYGDWTGFASATLVGSARTARDTVREIERCVESNETAHKSVTGQPDHI